METGKDSVVSNFRQRAKVYVSMTLRPRGRKSITYAVKTTGTSITTEATYKNGFISILWKYRIFVHIG
jgi:hypothetical protein